MKPTNCPTEAAQQITFIQWFRLRYPGITIFHIPNGGMRHERVGAKLKKMGVLPGVFDLQVIEWHMFIEFKRYKNIALDRAQKDFKVIVEKAKYNVMIVYGIDDAMQKVDHFAAQWRE